jgi:hypothetical protein
MILRVGGVVNAMMRWRVHHRLEYADVFHKFGVDPELVKQTNGLHGENRDVAESRLGASTTRR